MPRITEHPADPLRWLIRTNVPSVWHGEYAYTVNLLDSKDLYLGRCCLKPIRPGVFETHSSLRQVCHGKGLGIEMYSRAIFLAKRKGYRVCSSTIDGMSPEAYRLWNSTRLRKKHRIYLKRDRFWVAAD